MRCLPYGFTNEADAVELHSQLMRRVATRLAHHFAGTFQFRQFGSV